MSTQLTPFENSKVPAYLKAKGPVVNAFANAGVGERYKFLSIKSKVFTIVDGDTKVMVTKPGDDSPASGIEVVIVASNPQKSKVYYIEGYQEGSAEKPTCYSDDGISPGPSAGEPQAKKCATCAHNVFGSKITENGKKAKACSDSMRLAIAPAGQLDDLMLLRVPAASLKALGTFGNELALRGVEPHKLITRIGFDYTVSYPALTFKAMSWVDEDQLAEIESLRTGELARQITGELVGPQGEDEEFEQAPAPVAKAAPKAEAPVAKVEAPIAKAAAPKDTAPKAAAKKSAFAVSADDDLPATPRAKVKVEADVAEQVGELVGSVDDLDFDD